MSTTTDAARVPSTEAEPARRRRAARPGARPSARPGGRRARTAIVTVAVSAATLAVALVAVAAGSSTLGVADVARTLVGAGTPAEQLIVLELRLPRVAAALAVGASLALAGALTQTFARNPLATPDILGVTSGASLGGVVAIVAAGGSYSVGVTALGLGIPAAATIGALVAAAAVYGLSWRDGVDSYRLILVGIGVTAVLGGLSGWLLVRAKITAAGAAAHWLVGSLSGISWSSVWPVVLVLAVLTPVALARSRALEVGRLGDEMSTGLGVALQRHRLVVIVVAVALTAAAVSASGPVEFVAFVAPQIARRLAGSGRPPLLASAATGALVTVGADLLARTVFPVEVPVGIITVLIGAPYLIWLLTRGRRKESLA